VKGLGDLLAQAQLLARVTFKQPIYLFARYIVDVAQVFVPHTLRRIDTHEVERITVDLPEKPDLIRMLELPQDKGPSLKGARSLSRTSLIDRGGCMHGKGVATLETLPQFIAATHQGHPPFERRSSGGRVQRWQAIVRPEKIAKSNFVGDVAK
jgi:hypothetical protein